MIEAVVFDLDGTLVRLPIDYERLFEEFGKIMQMNEVRPIVDTVSRVDGETRVLVFKAWEKAELAVSANVTSNEEGMIILKTYAEKPKALVTLQGKAVVGLVLKQFGLAFDVVVTREDAIFRVDQLKKAISQLRADAKGVLFVGNTDGDEVAAAKVGCQFQRVN